MSLRALSAKPPAAIRAAVADDMTLRETGDVVKLTRQRVHQIVTDRKDPE